MKISIIYLFVFLSLNTFGQFKKVDAYTTSNGQTITTRDMFELGLGSGQDKTYLYITMKPDIAAAAAFKMKQGLEGKKYQVELIRTLMNPIGGLSGATLIFKVGRNRYLVDLENAIRTKEIILL